MCVSLYKNISYTYKDLSNTNNQHNIQYFSWVLHRFYIYYYILFFSSSFCLTILAYNTKCVLESVRSIQISTTSSYIWEWNAFLSQNVSFVYSLWMLHSYQHKHHEPVRIYTLCGCTNIIHYRLSILQFRVCTTAL